MGAQFTPPPPAAITRVLSTFDRDQLAGFVAVAIDLMDLADGDPDFEDHKLEDDFTQHADDGPGCPLADGSGDRAWTEWDKRARGGKLTAGGYENALLGDSTEDDEDDDPAEACGDEQDHNGAEDDFCNHHPDGPGCPVADPGEGGPIQIYRTLPRYGIDQSLGPVNEREAHQVWLKLTGC